MLITLFAGQSYLETAFLPLDGALTTRAPAWGARGAPVGGNSLHVMT